MEKVNYRMKCIDIPVDASDSLKDKLYDFCKELDDDELAYAIMYLYEERYNR